jgi:hypothetical protein
MCIMYSILSRFLCFKVPSPLKASVWMSVITSLKQFICQKDCAWDFMFLYFIVETVLLFFFKLFYSVTACSTRESRRTL